MTKLFTTLDTCSAFQCYLPTHTHTQTYTNHSPPRHHGICLLRPAVCNAAVVATGRKKERAEFHSLACNFPFLLRHVQNMGEYRSWEIITGPRFMQVFCQRKDGCSLCGLLAVGWRGPGRELQGVTTLHVQTNKSAWGNGGRLYRGVQSTTH